MEKQDLTLVLKMRDEAKKVLDGFQRELKQTGTISKEMATKLNTTNKAMRDADAITKRLTTSTAQAGGVFRRTARDLNDMRGAGMRVSTGFGGIIRTYGPLFGLAGGAFAAIAGLKKSVGAAKEFEKALVDMEALVGVSREQLNAWKDDLLSVSTEFGRAPAEAAQALYFITSSGIEASEAMDVLRATAMGAAAGMGDMMTIADAATSAVNAYGSANLTAADAVGQMLNAVKVGKMEPSELAASMGQALGVASKAKVEFNEVAAATAFLSLSGLKAAEGITTVRQTLLSVIAPSKISLKTMKELGTSQQEVAAVFKDKGYLEGVRFLVEKSGGSGSKLRRMLSDVQAVNAALLITGENADKAQQIFDEMSVAGAQNLKDAFDIAARSSHFAFAQFGSLMKRVAIEMGDAITPALVGMMQGIVNTFEFAKKHANELKNAMIAMGVAGVAAFVAIKHAAISAFLASNIGGFIAALELLAGQFIMVQGSALTASGAIVNFSRIAMATGIGALIAGLGLAVYWWLEYTSATDQAAYATALQEQVSEGLATTQAMVFENTQNLTTATGEARNAAIEATKADRNRIAALHDRALQAMRTAQAEVALAQATLVRHEAANMGAEIARRSSGLPAPLSTIGAAVGGLVHTFEERGEAKAREAADRAQGRFDQLRGLVDGYKQQVQQLDRALQAPPTVTPPAGGDGTGSSGSKSKPKGGKTEAQQNWEDQAKAISGWILEAEKADALAEKLRENVVLPDRVLMGGTDEEMAQFVAQLDALHDKRSKAQENAIKKGRVLTQQQRDEIQLTQEEITAINAKVAAEKRLADAQNVAKSISDMNEELDVLTAELGVLDEHVGTEFLLARIKEAQLKAAKEKRDVTVAELNTARALANLDIQKDQKERDRKSGLDAGLAEQDAKRRMEIGFHGTPEQQKQLALWDALIAKRKAYGDLTVQLSDTERDAILRTVGAQQQLTEAQEKFMQRKQEAMAYFDAFASFFRDTVFGAKSLKEAINDLIKTLMDLIWQYMILIPLKKAFETAAFGAPIGSANGNVFSGGSLVPFAKGGVVAGPVMFPIKGGKTGLMGEAGPEAIMPLQRDGQGRLGVRAAGGGSTFAPSIAVQVTAPEGVDDPVAFGRIIGDAIDTKLHKFVEKQSRYGGAFWGARS